MLMAEKELQDLIQELKSLQLQERDIITRQQMVVHCVRILSKQRAGAGSSSTKANTNTQAPKDPQEWEVAD